MKKQFLILFTILLCSKSISQEKKEWNNYKFIKNGTIASVVINLGVNDKAPLKEFPYLVINEFNLRTCDSLGRPDLEELSYFIDHIYITLEDVLYRTVNPHEVGIFTYQCKRMFYSYVSDTINLRDSINTNLKKNYPDYSYNIKLQLDKDWTVYKNELYPNKYNYELMLSENKLMKLHRADVNDKQPIKYDFHIYFKSKSNIDKFLKITNEKKIKFEDIKKTKSDLGQYLLTISAEKEFNAIFVTDLVFWLKDKAPLFKGKYGDWDSSGNPR
jgi:hypothetical protein